MKRGVAPLLEDAQRRQHAKEQLEQIMTEKANLDANRAFINTKSDKVLYDRFLNDFTNAAHQMELDSANDEATINCIQMSSLFMNLGYVQNDSNDQEQLLLAIIWKMVGGNPDGEGQVLMHNVKVVMCSILNFHIDWMIDYDRNDFNKQQVGRFEDGILYLNPLEIAFMTKKFIQMYKNRQHFLANTKKTHY